ncbi:unnamed protein product [Cuscuta campestris]|uniref:Uncharacterized protein n=1 Tax=Cuscuta campestris TaxID=132261 RepID=A0A484LF11_9ASTE|nr:unnamed protein product [Cuscuta campestris]
MATLASSSSLYAPCSHSPLRCSSSKPILLFSNSLRFTLAHHHHKKVRYSNSQIRSAKNSFKNEEEEEDQSVPSWAKPGSEDPPPWAKGESKKDSFSFEVPFYVYLLASSVTAIAAIGSVFEYVSKNPVFGIVRSDSVFYTPLLGFFAVTGIPTSAYLWFKSVQVANKEAEEQDKKDGYL